MTALKIKTGGLTVIFSAITVYPSSVATSVYSDEAMTTAVTLPATISADTTYYVRQGTVNLTVTQLDGSALTTDPVQVYGPSGATVDVSNTGSAVSRLAEAIDVSALSGTYVQKALPTGITGNGTYNQALSLYNYKPYQFRRTLPALASAFNGTGLCRIHCHGDSLTAGAYPTASAKPDAQSYPVYLSKFLNARGVTKGGTGFVPAGNNMVGWYDSRWTIDAAFTIFAGPTPFLLCSSSGKTATFVSDVAGTVVEINHMSSTANATYSIDGGGAVTFPSSGGTGGKITVTGLANTTHTVAITTTSAAAFYLCGVQVRNTTGVVISNFGLGSAQTTDWYTGAIYYKPGNLYRALETPNLTIIEYMALNDYSLGSLSAATSQSQLSNIVAASKAIGSDVLLVMPMFPNTANISANAWAPFVQNAYTVADAQDVPLLDMGDRWGPYATSNANSLMQDWEHPSALGYQDWAQAVLNVLI